MDSLVTRFFNGQHVNIKSVGKHPWWIDDSGSQYEAVRKHPQYWEIAQYCVKKFISGATAWSVFTDIQENHPDLAKNISYQKLRRMRKNRALIGEYTVNYENQTRTLKNYFPPLCSEEEFSILAYHINNKQSRGPKTTTIKLLSGMRLFRCGHCGGTMDGTTQRGKIIYRCSKSISKSGTCTPWTVSHVIVDHCVIVAMLANYIHYDSNINYLITDINNKIKKPQRRIR
ncbi:MAG: recombinase zinc beta ribbon domain-containing protein [Pseudomonadota bacterium]